MRVEAPGVMIGDTEPLAGSTLASDYTQWLTTFRSIAGYDLAFLHMDIDWGRPNWAKEVHSIEEFGRSAGVPIGLIYTGNFEDADDEAWLSAAGERVKTYELEVGGRPDHVLFQSWHDHPDRVLPETEPNTFTGFIQAYFEDRSALGFRREGAGANLAFKKPVTVSAALADTPGSMAVDGNPGSWWGAGAFAPQWIEVDLGAAHNIREIRLIPSQSPAGVTVHRVMGKGPGTDGAYVLLHAFQGATQDGEALAYSPSQPWQDIRYIRVQTVSSPSWVAWREVQVIDAGG
jgi:hypothetical protein